MVSMSTALKGTPSLSNKPFTCSNKPGSAIMSRHASIPQHLGVNFMEILPASHSSTEGAVGRGIHDDWVFLQPLVFRVP